MPDITLHRVCLPHHHFLQVTAMAVDFLLQEGGRADLKEAEARKRMTVRILLKIKIVTADKIDTNVDTTVVKQPVEDLTFIIIVRLVYCRVTLYC